MPSNNTHVVRFQIRATRWLKQASAKSMAGIRHDLDSRGGCVRSSESVPSSSTAAVTMDNLSSACATRSRNESTSDIFRRSASCENKRSRGLDFRTVFEPDIFFLAACNCLQSNQTVCQFLSSVPLSWQTPRRAIKFGSAQRSRARRWNNHRQSGSLHRWDQKK
jgi:hypothetical protein